MIWLEFIVVSIVICLAGSQLSRYGDAIAEKTGVGKSWIGLVLLATVTSLPELFTGISAITFNDLPDMAVSGTIGSCMFNVLIIAMLDLMSRKMPISHMVHQGHMISSGFGIILMGFAAIDILFGRHLPVLTFLNRIDPLSILFIIVYLMSMKLIYSYEKQRVKEFAGEIATSFGAEPGLKKATILFGLNAIVIVIAASLLPSIGEQIATATGWGQSFIGSSFIAVSTSLPELSVSFTAARRGSFDMAVANLLGSNLFNIAILAIMDLFYLKQPLLRCVSQANTITALSAMITMAIVVVGLTYRSEKKYWFLAGDALAILAVYVLANVLLFIAH